MNNLQELLSRYDKPGPRYTSYPTAPVWSDDFSAADYAERLRAGGQSDEVMSLYVHIPYCNAMCFFCGCASVITRIDPVASMAWPALRTRLRKTCCSS